MKTSTQSLKNFRIALLSSVIVLALFSFQSCKKDCFPLKGKGDIISVDYAVPPFTSVSNSISANVYLTQDSVQSIRIETNENIHEIINLKVIDQDLKIEYSKKCGSINNAEINIYISAPTLTGLKLSGSGNMQTMNQFNSNSFEAKVSGSGNITASVNSLTATTAKISGSGDIYLSGSTLLENFAISGSGSIRSFALESEVSTVEISGSGNADVFVNDQLDAKISGSGDIRYKGNAAVTRSVSGSGNVTYFP